MPRTNFHVAQRKSNPTPSQNIHLTEIFLPELIRRIKDSETFLEYDNIKPNLMPVSSTRSSSVVASVLISLAPSTFSSALISSTVSMFVAVASPTSKADGFALRFENAIIGLRIPCLTESFACEIGFVLGAKSRDLDLMQIGKISRLFSAGNRDLSPCQIRRDRIDSRGIART